MFSAITIIEITNSYLPVVVLIHYHNIGNEKYSITFTSRTYILNLYGNGILFIFKYINRLSKT